MVVEQAEQTFAAFVLDKGSQAKSLLESIEKIEEIAAVDGTRLRHATKVPGASINDLTDPDLLDVSGNAALNGVAVTVETGRP